ncbi:hypothetical protein AM493_09985 [Flavobacterium akiainvivens]|uniref:Gliding motility-associated protein GldM C-terminal domain-containing protein n=1 Tax=Flavobacterium akiainvivens TaxID=1202724 RepID=A0A0M8MI81_9FLAO|nr:GldM family protein [Flavobacterium akiainvivens]KOS06327.1 hypothetical protein AM493_09985 [Flavobacterium akiainvivens]SFQ16166.1 GldM C-terminal domain-containing protein [Flavobacterium akiainvivens]
MKKFITFLILTVTTITLTSCKSSAVFDCDAKVKILYRDIMNQVYIHSPDVHKIKFTSDKANVSILNDSTLLVITQAKGRVDIKMEYKATSRILSFRAQSVPEAKLSFRGRVYDSYTPMPVNEARATQNANASISDFAYDCQVEFISMDIFQIRDKQVIYSTTTNGHELNGALQRAQAGDTYIFSNIRLKLTGGGEFKGADTILKIAEAK